MFNVTYINYVNYVNYVQCSLTIKLISIEAAMAQQINRSDLRSRGTGFDSGGRPFIFCYIFTILCEDVNRRRY